MQEAEFNPKHTEGGQRKRNDMISGCPQKQ